MELTLEEMIDIALEMIACTVAIGLINYCCHLDIFTTIIEKVM